MPASARSDLERAEEVRERSEPLVQVEGPERLVRPVQ